MIGIGIGPFFFKLLTERYGAGSFQAGVGIAIILLPGTFIGIAIGKDIIKLFYGLPEQLPLVVFQWLFIFKTWSSDFCTHPIQTSVLHLLFLSMLLLLLLVLSFPLPSPPLTCIIWS